MAADFDQIAEHFAQILPIVRRRALAVVVGLQQAGVSHARFNLLEQRAHDTGATERGIVATQPQEMDNGWRGEVRPTAPQSIFIERGRGAGKRMPPGGVLLGWMSRHGIPASAEFVVRRAIGRRGIRPRPFMAPLPLQLEPERQRLLAQAREAVAADVMAALRLN